MDDTYDDIKPKHSFSIDIGLPVATANKAYRSWMDGLVNVSTHYYYSLPNNLSVGAGIHYSYFKVDEFKVPEKTYGGINNLGAFVRVGYEKFHTMRFGTDFSLKAGYVHSMYNTDKLRAKGNTVNFGSIYAEPVVGFILTAGEFISYRLNIGYTFQGNAFNNDRIGIDNKGGLSGKDFTAPTQFMTFGFGFTYYFKQRL